MANIAKVLRLSKRDVEDVLLKEVFEQVAERFPHLIHEQKVKRMSKRVNKRRLIEQQVNTLAG